MLSASGRTWAVLRPFLPRLIEGTIFPLLCLNDADAEMFEDDPQEYIRKKFDMMDEHFGPDLEAPCLRPCSV